MCIRDSLGLGLEAQVLGLGLEAQVLGLGLEAKVLGLGLEAQVLGLGLGLGLCVLDSKTGMLLDTFTHNKLTTTLLSLCLQDTAFTWWK